MSAKITGYPRVSIDALFRVVVHEEIAGTSFYVRALSDIQVQERDRYAMLTMVNARREAANPESVFHKTYVAGMKDASKDELIQAILAVAEYDLAQEAQLQVIPKILPFPVNEDGTPITPEETQAVVEAREAEFQRVTEARVAYVRDGMEKITTTLKEKTQEELALRAQNRQIQSYGQTESFRAMVNYTLFACVYRDEGCTKSFFKNPEEPSEISAQLRTHLQTIYFAEIDRVSLTDIQYFLSTAGSKGTSRPESSSEPAVQS